MKESIDIIRPEAEILGMEMENPFPGLRPFTVDESHLFFGREGQSDEVLLKLSRNHFVGVIGASGSGKSSFMFCGVIPILYGGFMTNTTSNWKVVLTRPGNAPIENLAESLLKSQGEFIVAEEDEKQLRRTIASTLLRSSSLGLVEAVEQLGLSQNQNILILVDQFEELFRFKKSEEFKGSNESLAFVNLLLEAIRNTNKNIYLAITMRSDFIGDCAQFPELTRHINDSHYLIPQMVREQKRMAIEGPIAVSGSHVAPRLVQQILNDLGDNPDQLPIMQHSLMRTFDYWSRNHEPNEAIDLRHYEAIGFMSGALSMHADEAYDELTDAQKGIAEIVFKSLTEKGSDAFGIRRPTRLGTIAAIASVPVADVIPVVERFRAQGRSLLTPSFEHSLTEDSIIDISHESLMRIWQRLKRWVEEESESVSMYLRLSEAAAMYQIGKASLWRPPDLQLALNWRDKNKPTLEWAERYDPAFERAIVFLRTSQEAFEEEQRLKELLQKRMLKRARIVALVLGIAAVISIGFFVYALLQKQEADRNATIALKNEAIANQQKKIALNAKEKAELAEKIALQEKAEAERQKEIAEQQRIIADQQRLKALQNAEEARKQTRIAEMQRELAERNEKEAEKQKGIAENNANEAFRLRMLAIKQSMAIKSVQNTDDTMLKAVVAMQSYNFNKKFGGNQNDHDVYDALYYSLKFLEKEEYNALQAHKNTVRSIDFSSDNTTMFSAGTDGQVLKWNMGQTPHTFETVSQEPGVVRDMAISPDNKWMAIVGDNASVKLFNLNDLNAERKLSGGHTKTIFQAAFHPDGQSFFTVAADSNVVQWDVTTGTYKQLFRTKGKPKAISIEPFGKSIAVVDELGNFYIQNLATNELKLMHKDAQPATAVSFSQTGVYIATGYENGLVKLWDATTGNLIVNLTGQKARINDIEFGKEESLLATASFDKSVRVYDLFQLNEQPLVLRDHDNWVWTLAFSPDGNKLMAGCSDKYIRVWPTSTQYMAEQLCPKITRDMTQAEWERFVAKDIKHEKTCGK